MSIGKQIKKIRLQRGFTQKEVAVKAGVAQSMVSQIETNRYMGMEKRFLDSVIDALETSYTELEAMDLVDTESNDKIDIILSKLDYIVNCIENPNGEVLEMKPYPINKYGESVLLPIEFDPIVSVRLHEPVGKIPEGDILIFAPVNGDFTIDPEDYLLLQTNSGAPTIVQGPYSGDKPILGVGIRHIRSLKTL